MGHQLDENLIIKSLTTTSRSQQQQLQSLQHDHEGNELQKQQHRIGQQYVSGHCNQGHWKEVAFLSFGCIYLPCVCVCVA